jgi:hypothetical protein
LHLYGIERDDADYILETFPIVKRKEMEHGEYRTKRVILEIYDAMRQAMETCVPYQTRLDPPPANGWTPPEELLQVAFAAPQARTAQQYDGGVDVTRTRKTAPVTSYTPETATSGAVREAAEDFTLVSPPAPTPTPVLDIGLGEVTGDLSARVRVNGRPGVLLSEAPTGDGKLIVSVLFDGETKPRKYFSPPALVERLAE